MMTALVLRICHGREFPVRLPDAKALTSPDRMTRLRIRLAMQNVAGLRPPAIVRVGVRGAMGESKR